MLSLKIKPSNIPMQQFKRGQRLPEQFLGMPATLVAAGVEIPTDTGTWSCLEACDTSLIMTFLKELHERPDEWRQALDNVLGIEDVVENILASQQQYDFRCDRFTVGEAVRQSAARLSIELSSAMIQRASALVLLRQVERDFVVEDHFPGDNEVQFDRPVMRSMH